MSLVAIASSAVLPSGRFAVVRDILTIDWYLALKSDEPQLSLIQRLVLIDDEVLSMEDVLEMPLGDHLVILNLINAQLARAKKTENGVK